MLLERSEILIKAGQEENFIAAMHAQGIPILSSLAGVESVSFGRGVENPDKFMLLIEWESMEAHTAFTKAAIFPKFVELIGQFSCGGSMEHFQMG